MRFWQFLFIHLLQLVRIYYQLKKLLRTIKTEITQTYPVSTDDIEGVIEDVKLT